LQAKDKTGRNDISPKYQGAFMSGPVLTDTAILSTHTHKASLKYRADIDGLRSIAILSVVLYHAGLTFFPGGFVGVDVFFVISGYLIGFLVYDEIRTGTFSIGRFYQRRAKRILPALCVVLLLTLTAGFLLLAALEKWKLGSYLIATIFSSSNILSYTSSGYFEQKSEYYPLLMAWSLGVEEQFYIFFPLLMMGMKKLPLKKQFRIIALLAGISLLVSVLATKHYPSANFYLLPFRAWELAAGVLLALRNADKSDSESQPSYLRQSLLGFSGLLLIAIAIFCYSPATPFPGASALLPVLGSVLIISGRGGIVNRALCNPVAVFIGLISYSLYLWHWPILSFAHLSVSDKLNPIATAELLACAFAFSAFSYFVVEKPFRRKNRQQPKQTLIYAAIALTILLIPSAYMMRSLKMHSGNTQLRMLDADVELSHFNPCFVKDEVTQMAGGANCMPQHVQNGFALLGDSHAGAISDAVRAMATRAGYDYIEIGHSACPALMGVTRTYRSVPALPHACSVFNKSRYNYVLADKNIKVVMLVAAWGTTLYNRNPKTDDFYLRDGQDPSSGSYQQSLQLFESGLNYTVQTLLANGKEVYILKDTPSFNVNPLLIAEARVIPARRAFSRLLGDEIITNQYNAIAAPITEPQIAERRIIDSLKSKYPQVHVFDTRSNICNSDMCSIMKDQREMWVDNYHLSAFGGHLALAGLELRPAKSQK